MSLRLTELVGYSKRQRESLLAAVALVPDQHRRLRVDPLSWSVAEVLAHLHRVETGIVRLLVRGIQRARESSAGLEHATGSLLGLLDSFGLTSRSYRAVAPEPVMPRGELDAEQGLEALAESRQALLSAVLSANGLALGAISYPHPLLGPLNLYQWILFVGHHEARHTEQIKEIALVLEGGAGGCL